MLGQEKDKVNPIGNALAGSCASVFSAMWLVSVAGHEGDDQERSKPEYG
jgi:hypothetical protein